MYQRSQKCVLYVGRGINRKKNRHVENLQDCARCLRIATVFRPFWLIPRSTETILDSFLKHASSFACICIYFGKQMQQ